MNLALYAVDVTRDLFITLLQMWNDNPRNVFPALRNTTIHKTCTTILHAQFVAAAVFMKYTKRIGIDLDWLNSS